MPTCARMACLRIASLFRKSMYGFSACIQELILVDEQAPLIYINGISAQKTGNALLSFVIAFTYNIIVVRSQYIGLSLLQYHVPTNNRFTSTRIFRRFCNRLL